MIKLRASVPHTPEDEELYIKMVQLLMPLLKKQPKPPQIDEKHNRWYLDIVDEEHSYTHNMLNSIK